MFSCNPLSRGAMPAVGLVAVLLTPIFAQNQYGYGRWPATPNRYTPPAANRYGAAVRPQPSVQPITPNRYTPPPANRYGAAVRPQPSARATTPAQAPYRVAERTDGPTATAQLTPAGNGEHPLMPTLRWAYGGLENLEKVHDYSATMVKREQIGGKVMDYEYMFLKVRHKPFSVYMYFLGPQNLKGQEVMYIDGQNNGNMWAHGVGMQKTMFGTVSLKPDGMIAMRGQRYPITDIGVMNLIRRLVEVAEEDTKYGECDVKFYKGAKINNRSCTCIEVVHPVPRSNFRYHLARIFVDDELNVPIRYASYDWPKQPGDAPVLLEEYTYLNLKLNNGFTDADFDIRNPNYRFR